jgi:hypothetical protein
VSIKVSGTGGVGPSAGARSARPGGGEGFRIATPEAASGPSQTASVSATRSVMGVDALIALQDVGGPLERKRRAVGRASRMLDALDDIKQALLGGDLTMADVERLRRAIRDERSHTDDPNLEAVLDQIELRAAVEAAKLDNMGRAA